MVLYNVNDNLHPCLKPKLFFDTAIHSTVQSLQQFCNFFVLSLLVATPMLIFSHIESVCIGIHIIRYYYYWGLNAVLMRRQSCVEAYAEDAQAPASSFGSEKEGSLSKA